MDPKSSSSMLAFDIGGAHIKAFDGRTCSHCRFPLWQQPDLLADVLQSLSRVDPEWVAVTMTGELCDCFSSRRDGVIHIANAVARAFPASELRFFTVNDNFCGLADVDCRFEEIASANWRAISTWLTLHVPIDHGLIVDFGSTTTDLIPVVKGQVVAQGSNDWTRMQHRELVYTGFGRTPLPMVLPIMKIRNHGGVVLAAECFSTMQDAYLVAGWCEEDANGNTTADNRPFQHEFALARMARHFCSEPETLGESFLQSVATQAIDAQWSMLREAFEQHLGIIHRADPDGIKVFLIGEGTVVLRRLIGEKMPQLKCQLPLCDSDQRRATGAVAVWHLLREWWLAGSCR